jgi:hypothetical protein
MTAPTTDIQTTVGDMLQGSMHPLSSFLQEYTVLATSTCRHWPEGVYVQVTVSSVGVASALQVQLIIQQLPGSQLDLLELLRDRHVVLETGGLKLPLAEIELDSIDGTAHTAELELRITDIKPDSRLSIA